MKCWICGKEATRTFKTEGDSFTHYEKPPCKNVRCYCEEHYRTERERISTERSEYIRLKKQIMFLTAIEKLESQNIDLYSMKDSIDVVKDFLDSNPDKFDSSYEIIAAIVLVHNRIYSKMQYKIGKYQVDFLIPDKEVVLEIDGERHAHRKKYDSERDAYIKSQLGTDWQIIRISTDYLDMNATRLVKAIDKTIDYREFGY